MKLSEFRGDEALDVLADLIEPTYDIMSDKKLKKEIEKGNKVKAVSLAIKGHKKAVTTILAVLDREDPKTYEVTLFTLPAKLLEVFNDPALTELFQSQGQTGDATSSTPASESTEEN